MPTHILRRLTWGAPLGLVVLLVPVLAMAQGGGGFPVNDTYTMISNWTLLAAQFLNLMTWFVFSFLIILMDPGFMFDMGGGEDNLMTMLNLIWQLSRNLMNVVFAIALVGAAIYTVVTANKEFVAQHLKTFVLAVVLVNFSWFIPRVVLDIANVATATVYSLPNAIVNQNAQCTYMSTNTKGCFDAQGAPGGMFTCTCKAVADFRLLPGSTIADQLKNSNQGWECPLAYCVRYVRLDPNTATKHGAVLNGLIVNHARLPQLAVITRTNQQNTIADLLLFILREMVVVALHIALLFPLAALLVAMLIRIPVLWFTMAFMPFYFLTWVLPDGGPIEELKGKAKLLWDLFLKAALLPAAAAIPLSIGFIMANAGSRIQFAGLNNVTFNLIDGIGSFAQLLWVIMVMAIMWTATFEVLSVMTAEMPGNSLIGKIKETGEQAGKFAAELPLSTVPLPGPKGNNLLNMSQMLSGRGIAGLRAGLARGGPKAVLESLGGKRNEGDQLKVHADRMSDTQKDKFNDALREFNQNGARNIEGIKTAFKDSLEGSGVELNDGNFKEHVNELIKHLGTKVNAGEAQAFSRKADDYRRALPGGAPPPPPPQQGN